MESHQVPEAVTNRRVEFECTEKFYARLIKHLDVLGEENKSAWIRLAIASKINQEQGDIAGGDR